MKDTYNKNTIHIVNKSKEFLELVKRLKKEKDKKVKKLLADLKKK